MIGGLQHVLKAACQLMELIDRGEQRIQPKGLGLPSRVLGKVGEGQFGGVESRGLFWTREVRGERERSVAMLGGQWGLQIWSGTMERQS